MSRLVVTLMFALANAVSAQVPTSQTRGKPARHMMPGEWRVVRKIGLETELFDQPRRMLATQDRIIVADGATNSIKSLRITGEIEWKTGRTGSGPGEFRDIVDLSVDSVGNVLVYDEGLHRLTTIDRTGKTRRVVQLSGRTDRAAYATPGAYLLLNTASDTLAAVIDTLGQIMRPLIRMPAELQSTGGLAREMSSVLAVRGGHLLTFRWSSRMQLIDRVGRIVGSCTGIDSLGFAPVVETKLKNVAGMANIRARRIDPKALQAAVSATLFDSGIAVVAATPKGRQKVIDLNALH